MLPSSPCIGICRLDQASGLCIGCARTAEEVGQWSKSTAEQRAAIWDLLPERRARLGIALRRLPWGRDEAAAFVTESLRARRGTWVFGVYGAVAEFNAGADEPLSVDVVEQGIEAATPRGAVRFTLPEKVRVLAVRPPEGDGRPEILVLALPRGQVPAAAPPGLRVLGGDAAAIRLQDRGQPLFDLGLAAPSARFCVRVGDPALASAFAEEAGRPWQSVMSSLGARILATSPTRVVETSVGRCEVFAAIPPPGSSSPEGPHTHFLPELIATGLEAPPALGMPEAYRVGAIFHPRREAADAMHARLSAAACA